METGSQLQLRLQLHLLLKRHHADLNSLKSNVCDREHKLYADDIAVLSKYAIHSVSVLLEAVET